jgi:hypothetical protein
MDATSLIERLTALLYDDDPGPGLFNPYTSRDPERDRPDAVAIRRDNLERYITERDTQPSLVLLAEAPGPWGCRFSGVPITSESQLVDPGFPIHGRQSTRGAEPLSEYSAGIYWRILEPFHEHIFTWNAVPYHPFKEGAPMSIRTPRMAEIRRFLPVVRAVLDAVAPSRVVAVGRKAERALAELGVDCTYVRHPSQGGATLFEDGVRTIFKEMQKDER